MKPRDLLLLLFLASLWGGSYLFMRIAAPQFGPVPMAFLRTIIATVLLGALLLARGQALGLAGRWRHVIVVGMVNTALPFICLAYSTSHLPIAYAAIINATSPLFGALIAATWLGQVIDRRAALGLLLGFIGVAVLVSGKLVGASWSWSIGAAIVSSLLGAANYGFGANYTRRYLTGAPAFSLAFGSLLAASAALAVPAALTWPQASISMGAWACAAALGLASTGLAYIIYYHLIGRIGPARAITVTYIVPVFGVLFGALFLREAITPLMLAGGAIVLLGVALATGVLPARRPAPASSGAG